MCAMKTYITHYSDCIPRYITLKLKKVYNHASRNLIYRYDNFHVYDMVNPDF